MGGVAAPRQRDEGIPFGAYTLLRRIARGGMAEVFLARQRGVEGFERTVALKRILPHLVESREFVDLFVDEARVAARLSHPHIAHIYDFGKVDDSPFIAMEYVEGIDGAQLLAAAMKQAIPIEHAARIAADVCAGLGHAHALKDAAGHSLKVVHRDVSPQNILIGHDGQVKLVDFGIAKAAMHVQRTRPGIVRGKYAYMSPEQLRGQPVDGRSDLFSLGIVLYEWLAGTTAFFRDDPVAAGHAICKGELVPLSERRPDVPAALERIVKRALAVERDQRYANAADMELELEGFLRAWPAASNPILLGKFVRGRFGEAAGPPANDARPQGTRPVGTQVASRTQPAGTEVVAQPRPVGTEVVPELQPSRPVGTEVVPELQPRRPVGTEVVPELQPRRPVVTEVASRAAPPAAARVEPVVRAETPDVPDLGGTAVVPALRPSRRGRWLVAGAALVLVGGVAATIAWIRRGGPAAPAAAPEASLQIVSDPPGAQAVVDGAEQRERTPITLARLGPGPHTIELTLPGYLRLSRAVDLAKGETRTLELSMTPEPVVVTHSNVPPPVLRPVPGPVPLPLPDPATATATATVTTTTKATATATNPSAPRPPIRTPTPRPTPHHAAPGTLSIRSVPWAEVYEGGRHLGTTPIADLALAPGAHKLKLVHPGQPAVFQKVRISSGKSSKLSVTIR